MVCRYIYFAHWISPSLNFPGRYIKGFFSVVGLLGAVLTEKGVMGGVDVAASPLGPDLALLSSLFNHKRVCVSVDVAS